MNNMILMFKTFNKCDIAVINKQQTDSFVFFFNNKLNFTKGNLEKSQKYFIS